MSKLVFIHKDHVSTLIIHKTTHVGGRRKLYFFILAHSVSRLEGKEKKVPYISPQRPAQGRHSESPPLYVSECYSPVLRWLSSEDIFRDLLPLIIKGIFHTFKFPPSSNLYCKAGLAHGNKMQRLLCTAS